MNDGDFELDVRLDIERAKEARLLDARLSVLDRKPRPSPVYVFVNGRIKCIDQVEDDGTVVCDTVNHIYAKRRPEQLLRAGVTAWEALGDN